jgi:hypothetical protein
MVVDCENCGISDALANGKGGNLVGEIGSAFGSVSLALRSFHCVGCVGVDFSKYREMFFRLKHHLSEF